MDGSINLFQLGLIIIVIIFIYLIIRRINIKKTESFEDRDD